MPVRAFVKAGSGGAGCCGVDALPSPEGSFVTAWSSMVTACVVLADMHADLRSKLAIQSRHRPQFLSMGGCLQSLDSFFIGLTAHSNALELGKTEWILRKLWMSCHSRPLLNLGSQPLLHIF